MLDAVVIGSGPNGLSAAIVLARAGKSVAVYEAQPEIGGGLSSAELTLPGFLHDVCSSVHPLGPASPFFQELPLGEHGLDWIYPPAAVAHPFDDGPAAVLHNSVDATASDLGPDASAWRALFEPLVQRWPALKPDLLGPFKWPRDPVGMALFGLQAMAPGTILAKARLRTPKARALLGGIFAHSVLPLTWTASSAVGLVLGMAGQSAGWPFPRGGARSIARAVGSYLQSLGGQIVTSSPISNLSQLPPSRSVLFDLTPRQILKIAGDRLGAGYRARLGKFRYGPGVFKMDWALSAPIPWKDPACATSATVHVGGLLEEMVRSEHAPWHGEISDQPFLLLTQTSLFDPSRAPAGSHTAWAYCHVPNGSTRDCTELIERQIERFAPGFRDIVLARHVLDPIALEARNANVIGGDIGGGAALVRQLFARPTLQLYATSDPALFICSSSTPPGAGVHGMCGYHAAQAALRYLAKPSG